MSQRTLVTSSISVLLSIALSYSLFACQKLQPKTSQSTRHVANNVLVSNADPDKSFHVTDSLSFVADTSFTLSERSDAEIFFFANSEKGPIDRFVQFQFERLKPHIEGTYKYEGKDTVDIGSVKFQQSFWCFDLIEASEEKPESDIAVVQKMLTNAGVLTSGVFVGLKVVYLSEDKRSEMLIIYGEKTTVRNIDCNNEETAEPLLKQMYEQFLDDISIRSNQ